MLWLILIAGLAASPLLLMRLWSHAWARWAWVVLAVLFLAGVLRANGILN